MCHKNDREKNASASITGSLRMHCPAIGITAIDTYSKELRKHRTMTIRYV